MSRKFRKSAALKCLSRRDANDQPIATSIAAAFCGAESVSINPFTLSPEGFCVSLSVMVVPLPTYDFGTADAEAGSIVFKNDHFTTGNYASIDDHIDRIADLFVKGHNSTTTKLHQVGNRHD